MEENQLAAPDTPKDVKYTTFKRKIDISDYIKNKYFG